MITATAHFSEIVHDGHSCMLAARWCSGECKRARTQAEARQNRIDRRGSNKCCWCPIWEAGACTASLPAKIRITVDATDRERDRVIQILKDAGFTAK